MKKIVLICTLTVLLAVPSYAADNPLKRGIELYKKHLYEDAANVLCDYLPAADSSQQDKTYLSLGMICLANAELYRELYHASTSVHLDYLTRLLATDGKNGSRYVKLYLGRTLLEAGKFVEAAALFRGFLADKKVGSRDKAIATVGMGSAFFLQGKHDKARSLWSNLKVSEPEVLSALAAAYSRVGLMEEKPSAMCEKALDLLKQTGKEPSIYIINNIVGVYASEGHVEKGLDLVKYADLKAFFQEETLVKNKVIRFHDPALLRNLSMLYGKASLKYLEKAGSVADEKVKGLAQYYLGLGYGQFGRLDQSMKVIDTFISSAQMSLQFKNKARVRQAVNNYLTGRETIAKNQFDTLLQSKAKPYLIADILLACTRHKLDYPQAVIDATALVQKGEGKPFSSVNFALGKYYLRKKDYYRATAYMEAGRDKSNKNRIEYNDPVMLVNLAEAYYRSKRFSEALEIYFEMGKRFPAVRQIQVAMQGVYSMEQKSAGDARIL